MQMFIEEIPLECDIAVALFGMVMLVIGLCILAEVLIRAVIHYYEKQAIEKASHRVLEEYPEFSQTREDFRAFARKVRGELGWDSVSFSYR